MPGPVFGKVGSVQDLCFGLRTRFLNEHEKVDSFHQESKNNVLKPIKIWPNRLIEDTISSLKEKKWLVFIRTTKIVSSRLDSMS